MSDKGWAVVTGASAGIGEAFAAALAERGHPVLVVARRRERLEELAARLRQKGARVEVLAQDLATSEGVAAAAARAEELGPVDLLVNNAGLGHHGAFAEIPLERIASELRLNIDALVGMTRRLLPAMVARGRGGVLNVASTAAFQPVAWMANYAATKAFVLSLTEALAGELVGTGVRAMAICPGPTRTEFIGLAGAEEVLTRAPTVATPEAVVRAALRAWDGGRVVKIQGFLNAFGALTSRHAPKPLVRWVTRRMFRPATQKALPPRQ